MLYYSVEIKQYSSDVALALTALLLAARPVLEHENGSTRRRGETSSFSPRSERSASGSLILWRWFWRVSERYLILKAASRKTGGSTIASSAMSLVWALNFAGCYRVSQRLVSQRRIPRSLVGLRLSAVPASLARRSRADLLAVDQRVQLAVRHRHSAGRSSVGVHRLAGCFSLGAWSLGRRWKGGLFLLVSPILMALAASMLHRYPFHGRLLTLLDSIGSFTRRRGRGGARAARWSEADLSHWRIPAGSASARRLCGTG